MKYPQMIKSLLENDLYKFSMGQAIYHQFPSYTTTWTFKCRNPKVRFTSEMIREIDEQIMLYCNLRFALDEIEYLRKITWIKEDYLSFLKLWHPQYENIIVMEDPNSPNNIRLEAIGTWLNTSMYEVPILAIVNEVYFRFSGDYEALKESFKYRTEEKINRLQNGQYNIGTFSEFGLRRRLSGETQDWMIKQLKKANLWGVSYPTETDPDITPNENHFIGTSNVYLAKKYNLKPMGTMAHEWIMCVGQGNHKHNPAYSNWYALEAWVKEYGVLNGIALTDTIGTDVFLKDFQLTYATLFSGVRHDSGDPERWANKILAHYNSLGIDPHGKTLLFSDSLDFEKADSLFNTYKHQCKVAFGIGTYLSNDTCASPLNIVMKVTKCNGQDVAKLSDTPGKGMCKNPDYVEYLGRTVDWRLENEREVE